jgi:RimJ/RimL family protein N-acetyltransferase
MTAPDPTPARPTPVIRGEQVYLRAPDRADIPLFVRWFNDGETLSYVAMRAPMSEAMEERWFNGLLDDQGKERFLFVIARLADGLPIGNCGLFNIDNVNGNAGIGITIGEKELWGQGFGTDAMNALVDFGFGQLRMERLWLEVYDFNTRARRSYEKCGFVLEGTERHAIFKLGRFHDVQLMSILRDEWLALERPKSWDHDGL